MKLRSAAAGLESRTEQQRLLRRAIILVATT